MTFENLIKKVNQLEKENLDLKIENENLKNKLTKPKKIENINERNIISVNINIRYMEQKYISLIQKIPLDL